jgi:SurA-like N-terminal domain
VAVLGAVGLGACALLAACSPVKVGAAATVGSQRITSSALDTQVSNLQAAAKPYGSSLPITAAEMPREVLSWMIRFSVMDQIAASKGISVTQAQAAQGLSSLSAVASSNGFSSTAELLVANGVPPQMFQQVGRWEAQQDAFARQQNGGKEPTSTAQQNAFSASIDKAQCTAAKSLNIQVSPQFGRFDYDPSSFMVVPAPDTLSRPAGVPSAASTQGLTPAC